MTNAWQLDATGQAELVRRGEASPAELVEAAIARIGRLNPRINAVVTTMFDEARQPSTMESQGRSRIEDESGSGGPGAAGYCSRELPKG